MRSIEIDGETIDQAIENALRILCTDRDRVEIEILCDATRGLLGFGGKKARVRATVRAPLSPTPLSRTATEEEGSDSRETSGRVVPAGERTTRAVGAPGAGAVSHEVQHRAQAVLEELLRHLGLVCRVTPRPGEDTGVLVLEVSGDSGGLVIGRRGQTLDAIEYMVNRIVGRDEESRPGRIIVDAEGYRERRRKYLDELARRLADKVRQTGRAVTLNPMSPRDRRIVHLAVQGDPEVVSRSQGEGHFRKVLIVPAEDRRHGGAGRPPR
jgi:spoIIIJ-associated protein